MTVFWQITFQARKGFAPDAVSAGTFFAPEMCGLQKNVKQPEGQCSGSNGTVECQSVNTITTVFLGNKGEYTDARKDRNCNNKNCFHMLPVML